MAEKFPKADMQHVKKVEALFESQNGVELTQFFANYDSVQKFLDLMKQYEEGKVLFGDVVEVIGNSVFFYMVGNMSATDKEVSKWDLKNPKKKAAYDRFQVLKEKFTKFMVEYSKYKVATKSTEGRRMLSSLVGAFEPLVPGVKSTESAVEKVNNVIRSRYESLVRDRSDRYIVVSEDGKYSGGLADELDGFYFVSVKSESWRKYFAQNVVNYKSYLVAERDKYGKKAVARIDKPGVDLMQELIDLDKNFHKEFDPVEKRVKGKIAEWEKKRDSLSQNDYFENFKAIYNLRDNYEAKMYLKNGVFETIEKALAKMDKESEWYKHFKPQYDEMVKTYIGEGGILDDSGYSFYLPMSVLLETAGQVIEGKIAKKDMFKYVPNKNMIDKHVPNYAKQDLDDTVDNEYFYTYGILAGVVAKVEGEAKDLQYRMAQAGIDIAVPDGSDHWGTMASYSGKVGLIERIYGQAKLNMSYVRAQLQGGKYGVDNFFRSLPENFEGKNVAKHTAERNVLMAMYKEYKAKWLDPVSGPFGSKKKFSSPLEATYLAMQALDEGAPLMKRIDLFEDALESEKIIRGDFDGFQGAHNVEFFKMVFPKWSYTNADKFSVGEAEGKGPGK